MFFWGDQGAPMRASPRFLAVCLFGPLFTTVLSRRSLNARIKASERNQFPAKAGAVHRIRPLVSKSPLLGQTPESPLQFDKFPPRCFRSRRLICTVVVLPCFRIMLSHLSHGLSAAARVVGYVPDIGSSFLAVRPQRRHAHQLFLHLRQQQRLAEHRRR